MTRLQKFTLWKVANGIVAMSIVLCFVKTQPGLWFASVFVFLFITEVVVLRRVKKTQQRLNPGAWNKLDEFESRVDVKAYNSAGRWTVFIYVAIGGMGLMLASDSNSALSVGRFTYACFIVGAVIFYELAHLVGVFYYTSRSQALEEREQLIR